MIIIKEPIEFEWDKGNIDKNLIKHQVSNSECEEVFFDENKVIIKDIIHSEIELRYVMIGKTRDGKILFIVFTIRQERVRIISARSIKKKEKKIYEKTTKNQKIQKRR